MFMEQKFLSVRQASDPSLIKWPNLGYSKQARFFRKCCTTLIAIALIIGTMFVVAYQSDINKRLNQKFPQSTCKEIPAVDAVSDAIYK